MSELGSAEPAAPNLPSFLLPIDRRLFDARRRQYDDLLAANVGPFASSVLDVGCGTSGRLWRAVPDLIGYVGVDAIPADEMAPMPGGGSYVELDVRRLRDRFEDGSFECVVALDVIEHLPKEDGAAFLDSLEAVAAKRVIVFTPNGFLPQGELEGNPYQRHLSGWTVDEFRSRGYEVFGVHGWRPLRGEIADVRWRPAGLWERVSRLTQGLVEDRPEAAFQLFCVKDNV